jgi:hypothetical protein
MMSSFFGNLIMDPDSIKNSLVNFRFHYIYPYFKTFADEDTIKQSIVAEYEDLYDLRDLEICRKRHDKFGESGGTIEDFCERIINLENERYALVGIRYKGLDIKKPFVSAWTNFSDISDNEIKIISEEFKMFFPMHVNVQLAPNVFSKKAHIPKDFTIVGDLKKLENVNFKSERVAIELIEEMSFYETYSKEYDLFHLSNPILAAEVKKESFEDLEESMVDKVLYKIIIDGEYAGVVAGRVEDKYGVKGICVLEKVLFSKFRKQGFGSDFQQLFINEMAKKDFKIIWGNIFHENHGSLKTAQSTGRQIVETSYFLPIV